MQKRADMNLPVCAPLHEWFHVTQEGRVIRTEPQPQEFPVTSSSVDFSFLNTPAILS